jgi:hypothetical protein
MLVTTHTLVATAIAVKTRNPSIYIPAALINHFVLDALPHFGGGFVNETKNFKMAMAIDALVGLSLFTIIVTSGIFPFLPLLALDLLAGWPDLLLVYNKLLKGNHFEKIQKWHAGIQKFESPWGILVDMLISGICIFLIFSN